MNTTVYLEICCILKVSHSSHEVAFFVADWKVQVVQNNVYSLNHLKPHTPAHIQASPFIVFLSTPTPYPNRSASPLLQAPYILHRKSPLLQMLRPGCTRVSPPRRSPGVMFKGRDEQLQEQASHSGQQE